MAAPPSSNDEFLWLSKLCYLSHSSMGRNGKVASFPHRNVSLPTAFAGLISVGSWSEKLGGWAMASLNLPLTSLV